MARCCVSALLQRMLPRAIRIAPGPLACRPVSPATAFVLGLDTRPDPRPEPPPASPRESLPEDPAVELCNFLHRVGTGIRGLRAVEGAAGISRGLGLSFEQYRQRLREEGVEFADLTGQAWSVDRGDFECADTPRAKLGIETPVIESCDRPVVTVHGECVQKARGLVVRPPQGAGDE